LGGDLDRIRVLIADDHTLVRDGTRRILETEKDLEVVAEASNGEEAVALTSSGFDFQPQAGCSYH